jgi:hypothetical protein
VLDVSLDGLSAEDRKAIRDALDGHCRNLLAAWNRFKEICKDPEWTLDRREQLKSILDAMR